MSPKLALSAIAVASIAAGCGSEEPPAKVLAPEPDPVALVESARAKLAESGITELRWGLTPYMDREKLGASWKPLLEHLGGELGVRIAPMVGKDYREVEDMIADGRIDLAVLSPFSYVKAKSRMPGLQLVATQVAEGSVSYGAYVITREDGPIETFDQIRGHRFGFVDMHSTSGWLYAVDLMLARGFDPRRDVKPVFLETHDRVYDAVIDGRVDVGVVYVGALASGRERHPDVPVRIIAKTQRAPYDAYVARPDLPREVVSALGIMMRGISTRTGRGRALLRPLPGINGFVPVSDSHYDEIRHVRDRVDQALGRPAATH